MTLVACVSRENFSDSSDRWLGTLDRVRYEPEVLDTIVKEVAKKESKLGLNDRIGLVNDVFALSSAGFQDVSTALALVDQLRQEEECKASMTRYLRIRLMLRFQTLCGQVYTTS